MDFPITLEDNGVPHIYAYSLYSSVAEKFEAIVSLGYDNSRFKDFYDLYILATRHDFDGKLLSEAVRETFEHRKTGLTDVVVFEPGFADDPLRKSRWSAFIIKKKAMIHISLEDVISTINTFLYPIIETITTQSLSIEKWLHEKQVWVNQQG